MAIVTNTFNTYAAIGIREQLDDIITNIAPTDTPFMSGIKKGKAENTYFEWQTDTLASAAANKQLQGDDVTSFTAIVPTVRVGNRTQISRKVFLVSGTEQAVTKAGRKDELAYQIALKGKELKRDQEFALTQNSTSITGDNTTAPQTRGLEGWIATNNNMGTSGVAPDPVGNTAATDGTARTFTESMLKDVQQKCWTAGGEPGLIMVGATQKQTMSTFTGNATRFQKAESGELNAAINVYHGDFGDIKVVPNRFQRARTAFVLQMDKFQLMVLRPYQVVELAKTGDAEKRMLLVEYGLKSQQEAASGAVRDLS